MHFLSFDKYTYVFVYVKELQSWQHKRNVLSLIKLLYGTDLDTIAENT